MIARSRRKTGILAAFNGAVSGPPRLGLFRRIGLGFTLARAESAGNTGDQDMEKRRDPEDAGDDHRHVVDKLGPVIV